MSSFNDRIAAGLDLLTEGLSPYLEQKLQTIYKDRWVNAARSSFRDDRDRAGENGHGINWDAQSLLTVMWDQWNSLFRHDLGHHERSLVSELKEFRNRWAHQYDFDFDDTYRLLDSVHRLLKSIHAPNMGRIESEKKDLLEYHVANTVNLEIQRSAFRWNRWWITGFYACCALVVVFNVTFEGQTGAIAVATATILALIYLIYQQFKMDPPQLYGPRECRRCHKIIYSDNCPYCASPQEH